MEGISILLAGKQPLLVAGLKYFIEEQQEFSLCGEVENREQLFTHLKQATPRLVIISYHNIPGFTLDDFQLLRQTTPGTHIMAICSQLKKEAIKRIMDAGVISILTRDCSQNEIINAIRATAQGEKFFCGRILDLLMEKNLPKEQEISVSLTNREIEIVRCITEGRSTKEIADFLNLSTHTINAYRKNLLKKLDVRSPAELAVKAIKMGFIEV